MADVARYRVYAEIEINVDVPLEDGRSDDAPCQAVQDVIGHTGAKVLDAYAADLLAEGNRG